VIKIIGINVSNKNCGTGKYAFDISKLINVESFVLDKNKLNSEFIGKINYGIYPKFTTGWTLNNYLLPFKLKFRNTKYVHLLSPINPFALKGIVTIHDLYFVHRKYYYEAYFYHLYKKFTKWKIIVPSEFTKFELISNYPQYLNSDIEVVPLGISKTFHNLNLKKENIILTVGDGKQKHNEEICKIIPEEYKHIHIGTETNHSIGNVSDEQLNYHYNKSIVAIRYSDIEGFGIPAIESLFSNCPIILKRIPVFEEILGYDYPLFAEKLKDIPELIEYAKNNNNEIRNYFYNNNYNTLYSIDTFNKTMKEIYKEYEE